MASSKPAFFIAGISGAVPKENTAPNLIFSDLEKLRNEGHEVTAHLVDPSAPREESVEKFKKAISGKSFDGVSIGFGVRGNPALTPLFEDLVNLVIQEVKPAPRMIFTENIDKLYVSVRRAFPKED